MILVDTSVWVDLLNNKKTPQSLNLQEIINSEEDICTTGLVITEILQGIGGDKNIKVIQEYFLSLIYLDMDLDDYILGANLYRKAKTKGFTIRSSIDCLISALAIRNNIPILEKDNDYKVIARFSDLKLIQN